MTDKKIADEQDIPHTALTARCGTHNCDLRISESGLYCPKCREEDRLKWQKTLK